MGKGGTIVQDILASFSIHLLKGVTCDGAIQHGPWPLAS